MATYNVHLYREMRLTFHGMVAASQDEAAKLVRSLPTDDSSAIEDCDGRDFRAVVDLDGDEEFKQSVSIEFEDARERTPPPEMVDAVRELVAAAEDLEAAIDGTTSEFAAECRAIRKSYRIAANLLGKVTPLDSAANTSVPEGNQARAARGGSAIAAYGDDLPESNLIDLLADIMHWCDANREDFHYVLAMACRHYINEINGQQLDERRLA